MGIGMMAIERMEIALEGNEYEKCRGYLQKIDLFTHLLQHDRATAPAILPRS